MKFAEKFLNMMKLNDADDETEPFDEEYNEVTEEEVMTKKRWKMRKKNLINRFFP